MDCCAGWRRRSNPVPVTDRCADSPRTARERWRGRLAVADAGIDAGKDAFTLRSI